jgi:hypothetical protein
MEGLTPDAGVAEVFYEAEDASLERCKILQTFGGFSGMDMQISKSIMFMWNRSFMFQRQVLLMFWFWFVTLLPIPVEQILLLMEKH